MAETQRQRPRILYGDHQCIEHNRTIAECSDIAFRDFGALLFDNCEVASPPATYASEDAREVQEWNTEKLREAVET